MYFANAKSAKSAKNAKKKNKYKPQIKFLKPKSTGDYK